MVVEDAVRHDSYYLYITNVCMSVCNVRLIGSQIRERNALFKSYSLWKNVVKKKMLVKIYQSFIAEPTEE